MRRRALTMRRWLVLALGVAGAGLLLAGPLPDLAAQYGERFRRAGFELRWNTCLVPAGRHTVQVFAESAARSPQFGFTQIDVAVNACPAAARRPEIVGSEPLR